MNERGEGQQQPNGQAEAIEADPRPVVALSRPGVPGAVIVGTAALAAATLFLVLDAQRRHRAALPPASAYTAGAALASPPPLIIPAEPPPASPRTVTVVTTPAPSPPLVQPAPPAPPPPAIQPYVPPPAPVISLQTAERPSPRRAYPAIVYDDGAEQTGALAGSSQDQATRANRPAGTAGSATGPGIGSDDAPARATLIGDRTTVMPVGTIIPAVLETPIDTARPGLVRAIVSVDARGFDGRRVLVQRGSRLIGEYQSDVRSGQNRVLVTWTRLIRPDGVAIRLESPAADPLGGAGVPGRVNTFFFKRFTAAVLQSALTVGVNLASRPGDGSVIVGLPGTAGTAVGQSLLPPNDLRPKITVKQGAALNVFVARDLDFSGVPSRP